MWDMCGWTCLCSHHPGDVNISCSLRGCPHALSAAPARVPHARSSSQSRELLHLQCGSGEAADGAGMHDSYTTAHCHWGAARR